MEDRGTGGTALLRVAQITREMSDSRQIRGKQEVAAGSDARDGYRRLDGSLGVPLHVEAGVRTYRSREGVRHSGFPSGSSGKLKVVQIISA